MPAKPSLRRVSFVLEGTLNESADEQAERIVDAVVATGHIDVELDVRSVTAVTPAGLELVRKIVRRVVGAGGECRVWIPRNRSDLVRSFDPLRSHGASLYVENLMAPMPRARWELLMFWRTRPPTLDHFEETEHL